MNLQKKVFNPLNLSPPSLNPGCATVSDFYEDSNLGLLLWYAV